MHRTLIPGGLLLAALFAMEPASAHAQVGTFLGKDAGQWAATLQAGDAKTKRNAAFALGKLAPWAESALPQLLQAFKTDPSPAVKDAVAFAIGDICKAKGGNVLQVAEVEAAMRQGLADANPMVKRSAAYALGCLGKRAVNSLGALKKALHDPNPAVKQNAAWALGELGPSAVLSLTQAVADTDPYVIRDAANALGKIGPSLAGKPDRINVLNALVPKMQHADVEVKKAVVLALVKVAEPTDAVLTGPLQALVINEKEDPVVRLNAAVALANIGGAKAASAVPFLKKVLESPTEDLDMRRQAAAVIGNIGKPALSAVPALIKALKDPDLAIRQNAATSLGGIGAPMSPALQSNMNKPVDPDRSRITTAVPYLINVLANGKENSEVREAAAVALKEIGPCDEMESDTATNVLIDTVGNKGNPNKLRAFTLWPLRFHRGINKLDRVFDMLGQIVEKEPLSNETKMLRYDAAYLLCKYKKGGVGEKALDTVLEFLRDPEVFIATGTKGTGKGVSESGSGSSGTEITKGADGRVIAIQALIFVTHGPGAEKTRVTKRADIMQQLKMLSTNPKSDDGVRDLSTKLLATLN